MGQFHDRKITRNIIVSSLVIICISTTCWAVWHYYLKPPAPAEIQQLNLQSGKKVAKLRPRKFKGRAVVGQEYFPALISRINQADSSVRIMMYIYKPAQHSSGNFTPQKIRRRLQAALERGVEVRMLLSTPGGSDSAESRRHRNLLGKFEHPNFKGYLHHGFSNLHTKLIIVDGKIAFVGAHNWTWHSLNKSHETTVLVKANLPIKALLKGFERLFARAQEHYKEQKNEKT